MAVRIVRLGTARVPDEGPRIGTVRRPPRGVAKENYAPGNWFDLWYPDLAPSAGLMARSKVAQSEKDWRAFTRAFRAEMGEPAPRRTLDLLALLSHSVDFSVGCYCEQESRCHRSVLRQLLMERGARIG